MDRNQNHAIPAAWDNGRPPVHTRFRPGQSGNPKGRPSGKASTKASGANVGLLLLKILKEKLHLREGERSLTVSKLEAALRSTVAKAAKGDAKTLQLILDFLAEQGELAMQPQQGTTHIEVSFVNLRR